MDLDSRNEKLSYRMRESQTRKIPYSLILGDQEKENKTISYRKHGEQLTTTVTIAEFLTLIHNEIDLKQR